MNRRPSLMVSPSSQQSEQINISSVNDCALILAGNSILTKYEEPLQRQTAQDVSRLILSLVLCQLPESLVLYWIMHQEKCWRRNREEWRRIRTVWTHWCCTGMSGKCPPAEQKLHSSQWLELQVYLRLITQRNQLDSPVPEAALMQGNWQKQLFHTFWVAQANFTPPNVHHCDIRNVCKPTFLCDIFCLNQENFSVREAQHLFASFYTSQ